MHKINDMKDLQVDYSDDPRAVRIAAALWWYYASKLFELLGIGIGIGIGIGGITPQSSLSC